MNKTLYIEWSMTSGDVVSTTETGTSEQIDRIIHVLTTNLSDAIYHVTEPDDSGKPWRTRIIHGRNVESIDVYVRDVEPSEEKSEDEKVYRLRTDRDGHYWVNLRGDEWSWCGMWNPTISAGIRYAARESVSPEEGDESLFNVPEGELESGPYAPFSAVFTYTDR